MNKIIQITPKHSNPFFLVLREFYLGSLYSIGSKRPIICKFIKVTPKGFNFLNIETSQCIMKRHLYARNMKDKQYPKNISSVKVWVPASYPIQKMDTKIG